jgi:hypothetical protein
MAKDWRNITCTMKVNVPNFSQVYIKKSHIVKIDINLCF